MRASGFRSVATIVLAVWLGCGFMMLQAGSWPARASDSPAAAPATPAPAAADKDDDDGDASPMDQAKTPEQRMQARFPQPIRVGDLVGQPLLDGDHATIGYVQRVVRTPGGKIALIVSYRPWASWAQFLTSYDVRAIAVPIEVVGSMGPALSSIDMDRGAYASAPAWMPGMDRDIPAAEIIQIAIARE